MFKRGDTTEYSRAKCLKLSEYSVDMQNNNNDDNKNRQDLKVKKDKITDIENNSDHLSN